MKTTWQSRFGPDSTTSSQQVKSKKLVWATPFTKFLSFDKTEKKLIPSASVIYKNPPTFRQILTNYQYIAHNTTKDDKHSGISQPCNKCSLCGKHGNNPNMVISTGFITSENNKKYFTHNALLVTTTEYTQRNAKYVIKFMSDKPKINFLLDGLTTVRFGKIITHKTILIKLLFCFISIITTKTSLVLTQTFLNATISYFYRNLDITITLILAKANGSEN